MRLFLIAFLTLLCAGTLGVAQDAPKDDGKPVEIAEADIKAADDLRLTLSVEQQTLYNGLRYLLRPAFEAELMKGRRYQPCTLPPFEDKSEAPFTILDSLRLLALLQSGMPVTGATDRQLQRFIDTPAPIDTRLAPFALQVLLCRAAVQRKELGRADELKKKAAVLVKATDEITEATSDKSGQIQPGFIGQLWFANHMWRALIMRAALELEIKIDAKLWEKDLRALCAVDIKELGWSCYKYAGKLAMYDLHPNLMTLVALELARLAPENALGDSVKKMVEKDLEAAPKLLARLEADHADEVWVGSRLTMLHSMQGLAPERQTPEVWREEHTRQGIAAIEPSGCAWVRHSLTSETGLSDSTWTRADSTVCETALTCIALSGGLFSARRPLDGVELANIGRCLYAFAVLHAAKARLDGDFASRVNFAIQDGVAYLAGIQEADGNFPGTYTRNPGNAAYCLLAMMHGGVTRDSEPSQRGLGWILGNGLKGYHTTYDVASMLMFFQKYYEPEQTQSGILYIETAAEFNEARRKVWAALNKEHAKFIEDLVGFLDHAGVGGTRGGWGYTKVAKPGGKDHSDNSCSQYAVLGYKAASLLGAELKTEVFENEATRLCDQYWEDTRYEPVDYEHNADEREGDDDERKKRKTRATFKSKIRPGGWSYMCGTTQGASLQMTAAGVSSLTICMDELKVRAKLPQKLAEKIGLTVRGAEGWVRRNYYTTDTFTAATNPLEVPNSDGWGIYYNLYSVERGCVLAGIRKLEAETDWYQIGAEALVENQNTDGSWGRNDDRFRRAGQDHRQVINTCLAILFLKQAAMPVITEHKKREKEREEREKEDPKNPVTGK
jgi:hypothetical protein